MRQAYVRAKSTWPSESNPNNSRYATPCIHKHRPPNACTEFGQSAEARSSSNAKIRGNNNCALRMALPRNIWSSLSSFTMVYTPPCQWQSARAVKPQNVRNMVSAVSSKNWFTNTGPGAAADGSNNAGLITPQRVKLADWPLSMPTIWFDTPSHVQQAHPIRLAMILLNPAAVL